jgi:hypothetical protein
LNSSGPNLAHAAQLKWKARARACAADFADKALSFWVTASGLLALFTRVADTCRKDPELLILHSARSSTTHGGDPSTSELRLAGARNDCHSPTIGS